MADDRGQDVVEVMSDSASQLADRLHLGGLGNLAFELGFLAIVLEQQQHGGIAKASQARDGQRDGLGRLVSQADRKVGGHGRSPRIPADGVGNRGLVFLDHEVARIGWHCLDRDSARLAERLVHGQETPVAIDQRETDRQHLQQYLDVGRAGKAWPFVGIKQQQGRRRRSPARLDRHVDHAQRASIRPLRHQPYAAPRRLLRSGR